MDKNPLSAYGVVTASHDVRGGGTGAEFAQNLLSTGTQAWNKWYALTNNAEVFITFKSNVIIDGLSYRAANDCPWRDPSLITAFYFDSDLNKWIKFSEVNP